MARDHITAYRPALGVTWHHLLTAPETSVTGRSLAVMHDRAYDPGAPWQRLREQVSLLAEGLTAPSPRPGPGTCARCRGPAGPSRARCYQCHLQAEYLRGLLPDVVVPVAYAAKTGKHARNLWLYKSARPGAASARAALGTLLAVFLRDHGRCVWRSAQIARPTHVALVPSGRGRPGQHPLQALAAPLALPRAGLSPRSAGSGPACGPDPERFAAQRVPGASVLLLDDTWTSGASATAAAAALRLAGARSVAVIVLGRHLDAAALSGRDGFAPAAFCPGSCAVHGMAAAAGNPS